MRTIALLLAASFVYVSLIGCEQPKGPVVETMPGGKDYSRQLGPGEYPLRKVEDPREIPDFTAACGNMAGLRDAAQRSLEFLAKPSSAGFFPYPAAPGVKITLEQAVASLKDLIAMIDSGIGSSQMNEAIRRKFDVYVSVGCDMNGTVLFTGYYTPIFNASPVCTDKFKYPLYRAPADLKKDEMGNILTKYPPRAEIEKSNMLAGKNLELFWLADPFEVFIVHVQGSARLRMPDGKEVTIGYTANNGYEYHSVGKEMIADGKIAKEGLSLQAMIDYFKAHPDEVQTYTWRNPRFVFFDKNDDACPHGCLNVPVTPMRSVAVDKSIFPRAGLVFVAASVPVRVGSGGVELAPHPGFALDQDAGNAIRAPGRCDIYMGVGDAAGALAGRTYQEGKLYYLFLRQGNAPALESATPPPAK